MGQMGQDLGQQVSDVVTGGDKAEADHFELNLWTEPRHLDTEMAVASTDHVVIDHHCTCLVVLEEKGGLVLGKAELFE